MFRPKRDGATATFSIPARNGNFSLLIRRGGQDKARKSMSFYT